MTYIATYLEVQPTFISEAIALAVQYRESSLADEGCEGIDLFQEIHRPHRFVLTEAWAMEERFQSHENAAHTSLFRSRLRAIHKSPFDQRVHRDFAVTLVGSEGSKDAANLTTVTHVDVPPPRKDETEALLRSAAEHIRRQPGNRRLDIFQQSARPNHFSMVAVWKDAQSFANHEGDAQTREFREALGPMLGALYDERLYKSLS